MEIVVEGIKVVATKNERKKNRKRKREFKVGTV